jgi:ferredoxin
MVHPIRLSRSNHSNAYHPLGETALPSEGALLWKSTLDRQITKVWAKRSGAEPGSPNSVHTHPAPEWGYPEPAPESSRRSQPITIVSRGCTLIVGHDVATVCACAERLAPWLDCLLIVLAPKAVMPAIFTSGPFQVLRCRRVAVSGCFGAFRARVIGRAGWTDLEGFISGSHPLDLVLDLTASGIFQGERLPKGFFAVGDDEQRLAQALLELPEWVGTFQKTRTIERHPAPCGHSHAGLAGCRRCLQVCPCGAIEPADRVPRIDPLACQDCAACASACPSGTLRFRRLPHEDLLTAIRLALESQSHPDLAPVLVLFQGPSASLLPLAIDPPATVEIVALGVPEIGCISLEIVLTALAYGAGGVLVALPHDTPRRLRSNLKAQFYWAGLILASLGRSMQSVRLLSEAVDLDDVWPAVSAAARPAGFSPFYDKRTLLRLAVENLALQSRSTPYAVALPADAPFGAVRVNGLRCTLCRACTDACASRAMRWDQESEDLRFVEAHCTQCGLCAKVCPEEAITLTPRLLLDRRKTETPESVYSPTCDDPPDPKGFVGDSSGPAQGITSRK